MSKKIDVLSLKGEKVKDIKLEDNIFNINNNLKVWWINSLSVILLSKYLLKLLSSNSPLAISSKLIECFFIFHTNKST